MPRVTTVAKARKDVGTCGKCGAPIKKGDKYLWWQFAFSRKSIRCDKTECYPKARDLTRSEWAQRVADFSDRVGEIIANATDAESLSPDDIACELEEFAQEVRDFGQEQQDKFDNMPEGLQQGDTGQLLEERAQLMESAADEIEAIASTISDLTLIDVEDGSALKDFAASDAQTNVDDYGSNPDEYWDDLKAEAIESNRENILGALDELSGVSFE